MRKTLFYILSILITILVTSPEKVLGQRENDSLIIMRKIKDCESLLENNNSLEALEEAEDALQISMQSNIKDPEAKILKLMGDCYSNEKLFSDAIPYYLRAASSAEYGSQQELLKIIYSNIASCYHFESLFDKEGEYYLKTLAITTEKDSLSRIALYGKLGDAFMKSKKTDTAIIFIKKEIEFLGPGQPAYPVALQSIISAYRSVYKYDSCIYYSNLLYTWYSSKGETTGMSGVKNNLGYYYTLKGDFQNAVTAYNESSALSLEADLPPEVTAVIMANAGVCYQNMQKKEKAINEFKRALAALRENGKPDIESRIQNLLALIYFNENDLYNAGFFSRISIESAEQSGDPKLLSDACLTYYQVLKKGNDPENALEYYERYLSIRDSVSLSEKIKAQKLDNKKNALEQAENELRLRLKEEKVRELAFEQLYLQLEKEEREKDLLEKERNLQLLEKERLRQSIIITSQQHLVEQQEKEKRILEQEQRIANLRLEQEEQIQKEQEQEIRNLEQQKKLDKLEIEQQEAREKAFKWIGSLLILVVILILVSLVTARRKNLQLAKQKEEIEEKNLHLEQQNEEIIAQRDEIEAQRNMVFEQKEAIEQYNSEIMKSIEYAKRIQAAALPDLSVLDDKISDHFLIFRPRDIVSGDFYWTGHVEGKTIVIVSDCTGHGVPGAFMSILGTSLIKEIIMKEYVTHPGVILRRLRKEIINALGQKGISGEQKDGMDLALLCIDHENRKVEYAGAYNSLYLVREKTIEAPGFDDIRIIESEGDKAMILYDIPADKMPIAHFDRMDKFNTREINIHNNDRFYLFTDGFADQFGGEKGKKFMYKAFKRMIVNNAGYSMKKQQEIYSDTLDKWMENYDQIDDICVMGIKI